MKPIQIYIDDEEFKRLDEWANKRGWTKSQAVRAAIRGLVRETAADPILALSGFIEGLPPDSAENFDRYLNETYVADASASYKAAKSKPRRRLR